MALSANNVLTNKFTLNADNRPWLNYADFDITNLCLSLLLTSKEIVLTRVESLNFRLFNEYLNLLTFKKSKSHMSCNKYYRYL